MHRILITGSQRELLPKLRAIAEADGREVLMAQDASSAMRLVQVVALDVLVVSGGFGETTDRWLMLEAQRQNPDLKLLRRLGPIEEFNLELTKALFYEAP